MLKNCDRCGQPVPADNSAINYRAVRLQIREPSNIRGGHDRHLHPVSGCEGSPTSLRHTFDPQDYLEPAATNDSLSKTLQAITLFFSEHPDH